MVYNGQSYRRFGKLDIIHIPVSNSVGHSGKPLFNERTVLRLLQPNHELSAVEVSQCTRPRYPRSALRLNGFLR